MSSFEVIILGVGDAFSVVHRPTALLLSSDEALLAVDCPDLYRGALRAAGERCGRALPLEAIDQLLLTHLHGDHVNGLEAVAFYKRFVEGRRLRLWATPEVRAALWDRRLAAAMDTLWDGRAHRALGFDDYFDYRPLSWTGENVVGPFHITLRPTRHHLPTCALRVAVGERVLGYSADTAFDPELLSFLEPAQLILHETNLGPAHTPYADLAALPDSLRRRLRLVHYPDGFDPGPGGITLAREGDVLRV